LLIVLFQDLSVLQGQLENCPWPVRAAIATGLRQQTRHVARDIAATASLELAASHYLGFGVERDIEKVLSYMRTAAEHGSTAAVVIVERLYSTFGRTLDLDVDEMILRG
jgi:TPR repeat protein